MPASGARPVRRGPARADGGRVPRVVTGAGGAAGPRVVIAAGGTAGHVIPALAVADALRARRASVTFIGGERAEAELVPAAGYPFHRLRVVGLDRRNPVRAARGVLLAARATGRARRLLRSIGADAVLGGGGYVAGPVGVAAWTLRLPLVLTEADSHLGMSNRLLAPLASRVFLAFPLRSAGRADDKYLLTGRPVPAGTGEADPRAARERFGIPLDGKCLLVFGGSLGARRLNEAALEAFGQASPGTVLHACGRRDHAELRRRLDALGSPPHYRLLPYIEPFADALAASDLVVARAGGSVFEVAAAGLPAILVPYPRATAAHQTANARHMARAGAAIVIPDAELDGARLRREVVALLGAPERMAAMAQAARAASRPDAADRIADELLRLVRDRRPRAGQETRSINRSRNPA
jgi:UDP-N-acetylglucosamine--N-acetylmuramyl-(pentapeptide) pyrophosphoryl-undecaprenol N-acetylglucosamine transferase